MNGIADHVPGGLPVVVLASILVPFALWALIGLTGEWDERERTGWLMASLFAASMLLVAFVFWR